MLSKITAALQEKLKRFRNFNVEEHVQKATKFWICAIVEDHPGEKYVEEGKKA